MFIDTRALPEDTLVETDICIIGAGAAGITLARELSGQPYQVSLLESGGLDLDENTQSLCTGEITGTPYYPIGETRTRYLGGSTNLWGGWSRPLDEIDFEDRPWMPYSGWPITKAELDPYYKRANKACNLGAYEYDFAYWKDSIGQQVPFLGERIATYIWQVIPPTHVRFGKAYRAEIQQARNINTYLYANVVEIETNDTAQAVTRLRVASLDGKKFWMAAKVFILAAGGLENPRLLLVSNKTQNTGLGNQYDLVGRFFMEHPIVKSDKILPTNPTAYTNCVFKLGKDTVSTGLALSKALQEREQVLNFSIKLGRLTEEWIEAFERLQQQIRQTKAPQDFPNIIQGHNYKNRPPALADLRTAIAHLDRIAARAVAKRLRKPFNLGKSSFYRASLIAEQAPNPDSRITLSRERDKLGLNRLQLDWRLTQIDKYTIWRSQQIIAQEFNRSGLGQFPVPSSEDDINWQSLKGSYHHIGTTRMSTNPREGVVDEHCQVHGISNLYVAGSSVFSTSGLSNPTLTIVALAIRLADRIKQRMGSAGVTKELETTSTSLIP